MCEMLKLKNVLNKFRGVYVDLIECDKAGLVFLTMSCDCRESLAAITGLGGDLSSFMMHVFSDNVVTLSYTIFIDMAEISSLIMFYKRFLSRNKEYQESLQSIENYSKLNKHGKQRYQTFVKFLRAIHGDNGLFDINAKEVLDNNRFCGLCSEPLFTKHEEMQLIIEHDNAVEAYRKMHERIEEHGKEEGL